jgi:hypothetical protein
VILSVWKGFTSLNCAPEPVTVTIADGGYGGVCTRSGWLESVTDELAFNKGGFYRELRLFWLVDTKTVIYADKPLLSFERRALEACGFTLSEGI